MHCNSAWPSIQKRDGVTDVCINKQQGDWGRTFVSSPPSGLPFPQAPLLALVSPYRQRGILDGDDGRLGLVDVPRAETQSVAQKVSVHRLALRRLPRDVQRRARRVVRGGDARLSRRLCNRKWVNDF